jgi:hypothetical protein
MKMLPVRIFAGGEATDKGASMGVVASGVAEMDMDASMGVVASGVAERTNGAVVGIVACGGMERVNGASIVGAGADADASEVVLRAVSFGFNDFLVFNFAWSSK